MGLTQFAASRLASISPPNWSAYETGRRSLTDSTLARLSAAIGFRPSVAVAVHRERLKEICAAHGATEPRLFGSVAGGTDTAESDLDIIVVTAPGTTLLGLIALADELEALCGVPVNVATDAAVKAGGPLWADLNAVAL